MADTLQHGSISGSASVRQKISGEVVIGGKIMKELRFLPYSEFPEIGREETLYIDTDNNAMYYYDGSAYVALSGGGGGGTDNYNALTNKPSVNSVTLIGNKTSSELGLQELISDLSTIRSGAASGSTAVQPETLETALSEKQDAISDLDDIRAGAGLGETAVQPSDMESALADKQDVISDLSAIRSGAAAGATAVQPDDMATALSGKQDTISDLSDIRSGASAGATAVQPADMETALTDKQDVIADLNDIRTGAAAGATAVQPSDMETALADKQDVISDLDAIRSGATAGNSALQPEDIDTLPTDGSSNPVSSGGTYNFVNSSIATNTAYFIGTFASVADLEAYSGTVTNNDYAFVTSTDSAGNTLYNRYKYNAATQVWSFEYAVNNTAFTAAQWAAIQSGMTSADKTKLDGIEQGANKTVIDAAPTSGSSNAVSSGGVHTALSGKQDTISDLETIRSGASAGATAVQPSALNDYQTKLSGTNKLDPAYIEYDATHRAVSDTEKSTWNGKQDTISDLSTIRSGAAAGATAVQPAEMNTALAAKQDTLTFDTVPTQSSTNPVTSGGVAASQAEQDAAIAWNVNHGVKNLLRKERDGQVFTRQDATWVFNGDSIDATVSGTVGKTWSDCYILNNAIDLTDQDYTLSVISDSNDIFAYISGNTYSGGNIPSNGQYRNGEYKFKGTIAANSRLTATTGTYTNSKIKVMIRPASITDSTFQPYALPNPTLTPAVIKAVDEGAKNLFPNNATSQNVGGVTFTVNSDGSITANGTKTNNDWLILSTGNSIKAGTYVLSDGIPIDKTGCQLIIATDRSLGTAIMATAANNRPKTTVLTTDYTGLHYAIRIASGTVVNNLTFYPMLCTKAEWNISHEYVPYGKTNAELTVENDSQQSEINYSVNTGVKNLLDYTFSINGNTSSRTNNGVTFTINPDRSISTSGTASANITSAWIQRYYVVPSDPVILSGCPAGGSDNKYRIDILDGTPTGSVVAVDYGNGVVIKSSMFTNGMGLIRIRIGKGQNVDGLVFKPMIRPASITDNTFAPYAKTNRELTVAEDEDRAALIAQVDDGAKNLMPINTVSFTSAGAGGEFPVKIPEGGYVLSCSCSATSSASHLYLFDSAHSEILHQPFTNNTNKKINLSIDTEVAFARFDSDIANNTISNIMLCSVEDYAVSPKFVPYAPTNRELYESKSDKPKFVSSISSTLNSQTDGTICGYVGSSSTIPNVSAEYIVARTYTTDNSLDRRIQIVESAGGARETRYYNGTSWGSWTPA